MEAAPNHLIGELGAAELFVTTALLSAMLKIMEVANRDGEGWIQEVMALIGRFGWKISAILSVLCLAVMVFR